MLEFFILQNTVYIMKDNDYSSLWKYFIKKSIKTGDKAIQFMEEFKSHTIMLYCIYVHGKPTMDKVMDEWKQTKEDDTVNELILQLEHTTYGYLIKELMFTDVTIKNVMYMIEVCLEMIRKIQYTKEHKLVREFLNTNPDINIVQL